MISDLVEFGKWLDDNNADDFGKLIKDNDRIITLKIIEHDNGEINFEGLKEATNNFLDNPESTITYKSFKKDKYVNSSLFSNQLFFERNQEIKIPSNANLTCLVPFVFKLDDKKKEKDKRKNGEEFKLYYKIEDSCKANNNDKEFIEAIKTIKSKQDQIKGYYEYYSERNLVNGNMRLFDEAWNNLESIKEIVKEYYNLLYNNWEIFKKVIYKLKKLDHDVYIYFELPEKYSLINDFIYFYCKYLKLTNESIKKSDSHKCQFCDNKGIIKVKFSAIESEIRSYNWNYKTGLENSRLHICEKCSFNLYLGIQKLMNIFENKFILVPKLKGDDFSNFKPITEELNTYIENKSKESKFDLLNKFLSETDYDKCFNFDFIIFKKERNSIKINKHVENYKAYLANFKENKFRLYTGDDSLNYLFNEKVFNEKKKFKDKNNQIENIFDIERLLKSFFIQITNKKIELPKFNFFYEIYSKDLKKFFSGDWDTKTKVIFTKYMHNIFNYVYELNEESLTKNMLNEIVANNFVMIQKNLENPKFAILKRLNYYFLIKREFLGDNMMEKENIKEIKKIFSEYSVDKDDEILEKIEADPAITYYLIGQFLSLIDKTKHAKGKKGEVFSNFVENVNRNNIRDFFVTEVLQKSNYYVKKMNKKGKFIFNLFENRMDVLFSEEGFSFEDYLILIFTGNYTENILSKEE